MPATQVPTCRATEWPTAFRTKSVRACQTSAPCSEVTRKLVALECRNDREFQQLLILTGLRSRNAPRRTLRLNLQPTGKRCGETKRMMGGLGRCRAGPGGAGAGGGSPAERPAGTIRAALETYTATAASPHSHASTQAALKPHGPRRDIKAARPPTNTWAHRSARPRPASGAGHQDARACTTGGSDSRHVERPDRLRPQGRAGGVPGTFAERAP